jgi:hypothetical protein
MLPTNPTIKPRKPRKDCFYSLEERKILDAFKDEYRTKTTTEQRGEMFRSRILTAMWTYWAEGGPGSVPSEELTERSQVCSIDI